MSNTTVLWEQIIAICPASLRYNLKILFSGHIVLAICQAPQPAEFVFWSQFLDIWHHWATKYSFLMTFLDGSQTLLKWLRFVCLIGKTRQSWCPRCARNGGLYNVKPFFLVSTFKLIIIIIYALIKLKKPISDFNVKNAGINWWSVHKNTVWLKYNSL